MSLQFLPLSSQRLHWYVNEIGAVPVHVPFWAVSVCPTCGVPLMVGGVWFVGFTAIAAVPLWNDPNSAPMVTAATASPSAARVRRPKSRKLFTCDLLCWSVCNRQTLDPRVLQQVRGLSARR